MHHPPRLRSRVFAFAALYAVMLFTVVIVLTSHARIAQSRAHELLAVDLRLVTQLEDVIRNQNAFASQWRSAALGSSPISEMSTRYLMVTQLLEVEPLAGSEHAALRQAVEAYGTEISAISSRWRGLSSGQRAALIARADARSSAVITEAGALVVDRRREIDTKLPALRRSARDMMAIALGVAYIVVTLSFALASVTLAKVVRPLEALSTAAGRIAEGDLSARAPVTGDYELAQMGASFNRMAEEIAQSRMRLEETARTDELTGLPNFRAFRELLDQEIRRAGRYGESFGMLVCDLDHFKKFNDRFGHLAGNDALRAVADAIRQSLRDADIPARYGGEEFVIILPNTDAPEIAAAAERLRAAVQGLPVPEGRTAITISIGGAAFPADGAAAEQLFTAADERLYRAKGGGRNRAVVATKTSTRSA